MNTNFKLDRFTVKHVDEVAQKMANDINYGGQTSVEAIHRIKDEYTVEYALWVMEKAKAVVGIGELLEGVE